MKIKTLLCCFILGLSSMTTMAGSGHDHGHSHSGSPVNQATATTNATKIIATFVERKKLDESWASIIASSAEKKVFKGSTEWVIVFVNDKITDTSSQKLYVFLTLDGDYIAANYTGN